MLPSSSCEHPVRCNTYVLEEPPWLFSESTFRLSSAFLYTTRSSLDLAFKQFAVNLSSRCAIGDSGAQNHAPTANPLASNCVRRGCYESCSRSRCQQFVADQRRSATSTRTESGAGENACERHLLHRRTSDARTLSRTISPNLRPRASGRDRCRGSRRHDAEGGRPRGYRLDSIHLRALRMVPAWSQNVLSLHEGHRN